jgi:hypothetical protein
MGIRHAPNTDVTEEGCEISGVLSSPLLPPPHPTIPRNPAQWVSAWVIGIFPYRYGLATPPELR